MVFAFNVPLMLAALVVVRFMLWRPPVGTAGTGGKGRTGGTG